MAPRTPRSKNKARSPQEKRDAKKSKQNENNSVTNQVTPSKPKKNETSNSMELDNEKEIEITKVVPGNKKADEGSEESDSESQSGAVKTDKNTQSQVSKRPMDPWISDFFKKKKTFQQVIEKNMNTSISTTQNSRYSPDSSSLIYQ